MTTERLQKAKQNVESAKQHVAEYEQRGNDLAVSFAQQNLAHYERALEQMKREYDQYFAS